MVKTKQTTRDKLVFSTAAFIASTAIGAVPASAWTEQEKRDAPLMMATTVMKTQKILPSFGACQMWMMPRKRW